MKAGNKRIMQWIAAMFTSLLTLSILLSLIASPLRVYAEDTTYNVEAESYEFSKGDYAFTPADSVEQMSFGKKTIGALELTGDMSEPDNYNTYTAYGVLSGNLRFSYKYNGSFLDEEGDCQLIADSGKKVDTYKLDARIEKGVLIVQKSATGEDEDWEDAASPVVNFFENNPSGIENFYTTEGADIARGTYYRIIIAYKTKEKTGTFSIPLINVDTGLDTKDTFEHVEVYRFYACKNSGDISIHNLSISDEDLNPYATEDFSIEVIERGETLTNGATTLDGFTIDKLGTTYTVSINGKLVEDGAKFTTPGKYEITTMTNLGQVYSNTIYVFDGGKDQGFSTYFDGSLVQGKRVFRKGEHPTYAANSFAKIMATSDTIPPITGTITNESSGETIYLTENNHEEQNYPLTEGTYYADLYSGHTDSGSLFRYEFHFNIIGEDAGPYANFNELMNDSERLSDLASKHYEVVYPTTAGGYIYVCFASQEEAFKYAYDIERRYVEKTPDGIYYKSSENPNVKVKYNTNSDSEKIELTRLINYYARQNVEVGYFNPIAAFSYQTFDDKENLLSNLESMSISESIKVFPSMEEREKLLARKPFINGFTFMHIDDYDVVSVEALCHSDNITYPIEFQIPVDEQLSTSSDYTITETSGYGDTLSYEVCYMKDNRTISKWSQSYEGKQTEITVSNNETTNGVIEVTADVLALKSIKNDLDDHAIVTISAPEAYDYDFTCSIKELDHIALYKKGEYTITFVDRVKNNYSLIAHITGNASYDQAISGSNKSYTDCYNALYLNDKPDSEER